jgi:hypothetical protein
MGCSATLKIGSYTSQPFDIKHRMPQGSPLSSILSALYTVYLLTLAESWVYADLTLYINDRAIVMILPTFFHFLAYVTTYALSVPMPPIYVPHHVPSNHEAHHRLSYTHVHHPLHPCTYLVLISCAETCYQVPMTCLSLTHSPPFDTIQLSYLVWFLIPMCF